MLDFCDAGTFTADPLDEAIAVDAASARLRAAGSICMVGRRLAEARRAARSRRRGEELCLHEGASKSSPFFLFSFYNKGPRASHELAGDESINETDGIAMERGPGEVVVDGGGE